MANGVKTIDIHDPHVDLAELISLVKKGLEVILTDEFHVIARLVPVTGENTLGSDKFTPRIPGLHAGTIWTSDDFDEPLPDEFWLGGD